MKNLSLAVLLTFVLTFAVSLALFALFIPV